MYVQPFFLKKYIEIRSKKMDIRNKQDMEGKRVEREQINVKKVDTELSEIMQITREIEQIAEYETKRRKPFGLFRGGI